MIRFFPRSNWCVLQKMVKTNLKTNIYRNISQSATTLSLKKSLPRYPVPTLQSTIANFIKFARPLQTDSEYHQTLIIASEFLDSGEGEKLQQLLEKRYEKFKNWLTPWWENVAYLDCRTPLPVITSPAVLFPKWDYSDLEGQIDIAAKVIQSSLKFYLKIIKNELPDDKMGNIVMDMSQYHSIFGTTRIPQKGKDKILYGYNINPPPKHIIVMRNAHIFEVPVFDSDGNMLSVSQIKNKLNDVIGRSQNYEPSPVGVLSSENRDVWAQIYAKLKESNQESIKSIEDSLFVVCLDRKMEKIDGVSDIDLQALQCLHGGGCHNNSANRWFDKTIQFIIGMDGHCGAIAEHTPAEGPPTATLLDFICEQFDIKSFIENDANGKMEELKELKFNLNEKHIHAIEKAKAKIDAMSSDTDIKIYIFDRFGKNFAKDNGISPDSLIQMAMQIAYYRIHRKLGVTYETGTLRKFDEGRTETIRLPNIHSANFTYELDDPQNHHSFSELADMLRIAIQEHKNYSLKSMDGKGMDRHLLGLRLIAQENGFSIPVIFKSDAYKKMMHFTISTSQVPTKHFLPMCFGPSSEDCYGVCYNPQESNIIFSICTLKSCSDTSSSRFARAIGDALIDMRSILLKSEEKYRSKI